MALGKATSVLALLAGGAMARCLHSDLDATATLVGGSRALALIGAAVTAAVHTVARRARALGFVPEDEPGPSNNRACPQVSARLVMSLLVVVSIVLVASMLGLVVVSVWQLVALLVTRRRARCAARRSSEQLHCDPHRRSATTSSRTKSRRRHF